MNLDPASSLFVTGTPQDQERARAQFRKEQRLRIAHDPAGQSFAAPKRDGELRNSKHDAMLKKKSPVAALRRKSGK